MLQLDALRNLKNVMITMLVLKIPVTMTKDVNSPKLIVMIIVNVLMIAAVP
jgi:hypothetical protein